MEAKPASLYSDNEKKLCVDPLIQALRSRIMTGKTLIAAIQGGQGTGKTTLAKHLVKQFTQEGYRAISFSIDDFYISYENRKKLAAKYHDNPYYQIPRGMPGTHRTEVLYNILSLLERGEDTDIPVFDKSAHNGYGDISVRTVPVRGQQDIVFFEGWCVGMPIATSNELVKICEKHNIFDDSPLYEAAHLDTMLAHIPEYQPLWEMIGFFIMLRPDLPLLHALWRDEQEKKLIEKTGIGMSKEQIDDFVRHFLPLTYLCYEKISPDICIHIDRNHRLYNITISDNNG